MGDYIEIKDFPNDVYAAVGRIIKASQELERDFKALAERLALPVKNINGSSLNKLNDALKVNGIIDNTLYEKLKKVVFIRNYINHTFFVKDFSSTAEPFDKRMKTTPLAAQRKKRPPQTWSRRLFFIVSALKSRPTKRREFRKYSQTCRARETLSSLIYLLAVDGSMCNFSASSR